MKILKYLSCFGLSLILITSCSKAVEEEKLDCDFTEEVCQIVPFCNWPPSPNASIALPIAFRYNGEMLSHEDYKFEWSSDLDFGAGAISVWYDDLPVTVIVTELATGCIVESTLTVD